jgi:hypothetical protein
MGAFLGLVWLVLKIPQKGAPNVLG